MFVENPIADRSSIVTTKHCNGHLNEVKFQTQLIRPYIKGMDVMAKNIYLEDDAS